MKSVNLDASFGPVSHPDFPETPKTPQVPAPQLDNLESFNSQQVLLYQYNWAVRLLHSAEFDPEVSLNQKAAALNSITSVIQAITKQQTDIYNAERLKVFEEVFVECLKELPEPHKTELIAKYEQRLSIKT